jgi:hypothetical protein
MPRSDDPTTMTSDERLEELAEIFAAGLQRLKIARLPQTTPGPEQASPNYQNSDQKALEVFATSRPHPAGG